MPNNILIQAVVNVDSWFSKPVLWGVIVGNIRIANESMLSARFIKTARFS